MHDNDLKKGQDQVPANAIRWKHVTQNGKPQTYDNSTKLKTRTNAKLIKWKDGTYSIAVGDQFCNLQTLNSKNSQLFERKTDLKTNTDEFYDQVGQTKYKMSVRPLKQTVTSQEAEEDPDEQLKIIKSTVNYEQQKKQIELENERKLNDNYKLLKEQMRKSKYKDRNFTPAYLEDGADKQQSQDNLRKKKRKEQSSEESLDDDFIVDDKDEDEGTAGEDEEGESDEDENFKMRRRDDDNDTGNYKLSKSKNIDKDKDRGGKEVKEGVKEGVVETKKLKKLRELDSDDSMD